MLTRDQLRYKIDGSTLEPWLLKETPSVRQLAADLLGYWRAQVGKTRAELEEHLTPILYRGRSLQVAKGLSRIIEQASTFDDAADMRSLRDEALAASASRMAAGHAESPGEHRRAVAAAIGCAETELVDRLYGDLPDAAVLRAVDLHEPETVIGRYNAGLCQGLLQHAHEMRLEIQEASVGQQRALLKALRFRGLLATVQSRGDHALTLAIAGPAAVIEQAQRYGQHFALLLPAIACLPVWRLEATLKAPKRENRRKLTLHLDQDMGIRGESRYLSQVPEELRLLVENLRSKQTDWSVEAEAAPVPMGDGELLVPDLELRVDGRLILVEFFHRWHASALERRLRQLAARPELPVLLGVDRALAKRKEIKPLLEGELFTKRGFCYSSYPGVRLIGSAVNSFLAEA